MTARDEYRFYARECLRLGDETDNEEHRQAFLDMATVMMQLAAHEKWGASTAKNVHASYVALTVQFAA